MLRAAIRSLPILFFAASLHAQSATGMYSGTFSVFVNLPPGCANITSFSYTGSITGAITQSGNNLTGNFILTNPTFVKNESGVCSGFRASPWDSVARLENGKLSNGNVSGDFIMFGIDPPLVGNFSGSTITVHGKNNGRGVSFDMTRTSTTVKPLVSFGYYRTRASETGNATLHWMTAGATSVSITWAGTQGLFGEAPIGLPSTNTQTMTATGPSGTTTATTIVKVARIADPDVVVAVSPRGIVQQAGSPPSADSFTLRNLGGTATDITLVSSNALFTVTPSTFTLAPIESQVVSVTATTQEPGSLHGSVAVSGNGVSPGLTIPLHRLVAEASSANGVVTSPSRHDVRAAGGTVSFTNNGSSAVQGVIVGDAPWITIPNPDLTLAAGETKQVQVSVDRSKRPGMSIGGSSGALDFRYTGGSAHTVIADTTESVSEPYSNAQLFPSPDLMMFSPGASRQPSSVSDLHISNRGNFHSDARVVFFPPDGSPGAGIDLFGPTRVEPYSSVYFPNIVKSVFGQSVERGSLLILGPFTTVAHTQINTKGGVSTITALPILRSDQAHGAGGELYLTGVKKSATLSTTLHLQEMGGTSASVVIDFFDAEGRQVAASRTQPIFRFTSVELIDAVPARTTTVRVKNNTEGAKIDGYARILDSGTSDVFTVVQLQRGTGTLYFPAFPGDVPGREMYLHLANASPEPITVSATKSYVEATRRRSARSSEPLGPPPPADPVTVTIPGYGSRSLTVSSTATGFVRVTGPDALRATATMSMPRNAAASGADRGRVGTGIALVPASAAMISRAIMTFPGVEESTAVHAKFSVVETSGRDTRIRLTLRYTLPGGNPANNAAHSKDYLVVANGGFALYPLAEELIGPGREAIGDLHNAALDVEVVNTSNPGTVIPFLLLTDNGTGDVTIRHR